MDLVKCTHYIIYMLFELRNINHFYFLLYSLYFLFLKLVTCVSCLLWVAGGAADDEAGFDDAFLGAVGG